MTTIDSEILKISHIDRVFKFIVPYPNEESVTAEPEG
jgi:hypothetical protein